MIDPSNQDAGRRLISGAKLIGLELSDRQVSQFELFCSTLLEANQHFNLTGLKTPEQVMGTLFLDSLTVAAALPREFGESSGSVSVVDVGTGAGVPGLPLKIVFPHWSLVLVESNQKKARFVEQVATDLGLTNVSVRGARAEELGLKQEFRDAADLCVARAVAGLPALLELCVPLVKVGGLLVFPRSGDIDSEREAAEQATRILHVRMLDTYSVPPDLELGANRYVLTYQKMGPTPAAYPRRIGLATSRPIGTVRAVEPRRTRDRRSRP